MDIRLRELVQPVPVVVSFDWLLRSDGGLDDVDELASAIIIALGTDALADEVDPLPDIESNDRRGWWGDLDAAEIWGGWPIGSRLWLLMRGKITGRESRYGSTVARAQQYTREALQPFLDNRVCTRIDVAAERSTEDYSRIDVGVVIYRGLEPVIALRFDAMWDEMR